MHKFWTIPIINLTHTRSQNHTNLEVNNREIQTFEVLVIQLLLLLLMLFNVLCPQVHIPDAFEQVICPYIFKWQIEGLKWGWKANCAV